MNKRIKMLACPFCGVVPKGQYLQEGCDEQGDYAAVVCQACGCEGPKGRGRLVGTSTREMQKMRRDARNNWNTRTRVGHHDA